MYYENFQFIYKNTKAFNLLNRQNSGFVFKVWVFALKINENYG